MTDHLNTGTVTALLISVVGLAVMIFPKLAPFKDQITSQITGLVVAVGSAIQLIDEIVATIKKQTTAKVASQLMQNKPLTTDEISLSL